MFSLKEKAIKYRQSGYSYGMISEELGLAKSTLSNWLREVPYEPNKEVTKRIKRAHVMSAKYRHNKKVHEIKKTKKLAKEELGVLSKRDLWLLGIGLYLGDGSKSHEDVRIINSDPNIIKLAIEWFKNVCKLENSNFVPSLHLYPDTNVEKTKQHWSKITGVPISQFGKTQIDRRKNKSGKRKRKLPYGTLHLKVRSNGRKEFGVILHRRIIGWIEACLEQI